jgi:glucosamine-6-phosphate deaminase
MHLIGAGTARNRIAVLVAPSASAAAEHVAGIVADAVRAGGQRGSVLVLPTGGTPVPVYRRLAAEHRAGRLSFARTTCFNLDEYQGLAGDDRNSYRRFMREQFFDHVDCPADRIHIPRGDLPAAEVPAHAAAYERAIQVAGGMDLALLGIGRNGHIGFNEPGSGKDSRTRLVWLDAATRRDAARDFGGEAHVPRGGVTMGVATILAARRIVLLAVGEAKAEALARAVEGAPDPHCPASWLQDHPDCLIVCDPAAASRLTAVRSPWLAGPVAWDDALARRAVTACALDAGKPILALTEADHQEHGLHQLLAERGGVHEVNLAAFRGLHAAITGWPGGKPPERRWPGDIPRPRDAAHPKTVLILSPHPDDDVIGMGGTLIRLVDHGHVVHVAHMTSGANAVPDPDVERFLDVAAGTGGGAPAADRRALKAAIRRAEARSATRACGLPDERVRFLDLLFYERPGRTVDEADVERVATLLAEVQPHQCYAAGDLRDPNGTHRRCLQILAAAIARLGGAPWLAACELFLYRGAWDGWAPHELAMAVPLAPTDVERKRRAILCHRSQADGALFPGEDRREFWQRAEDRCAAAAAELDRLGLAQYAAIEGFAAWDGTVP